MAAAPDVPPTPEDPRVRRVELLISNLLRAGVLASLGAILLGLAVMFIHHPEYLTERQPVGRVAASQPSYPHTVPSVLARVRDWRGQGIITLGLLILLLTPVARVAVSIFAFIYQRDRIFVVITATVLTILLIGFTLGRVSI